MQMNLPITPELTVHITPTVHGSNLMLAETYQQLQEWDNAIHRLREIVNHDPNDIVA